MIPLENAVAVSGLTKYYNNIPVVDHVSFNVRVGEIFGFLGPNGAGKTTTMNMLTGLTEPSEGSAALFGYDIQREALAAKRQLGIVPRSPTSMTICLRGTTLSSPRSSTTSEDARGQSGQRNFSTSLIFSTAELRRSRVFQRG